MIYLFVFAQTILIVTSLGIYGAAYVPGHIMEEYRGVLFWEMASLWIALSALWLLTGRAVGAVLAICSLAVTLQAITLNPQLLAISLGIEAVLIITVTLVYFVGKFFGSPRNEF